MRQDDNGRWTWRSDRRHLTRDYFKRLSDEARSLLPQVDQVSCPALVVRGALSDAVTAEEANAFAALLSAGRVLEIADAAHNVQSDNPKGLADALRPFLATHASA